MGVHSAWEAIDSFQEMTVESTVFLLEEKGIVFVNRSHDSTGTRCQRNAGWYLDIFWPEIFFIEGRLCESLLTCFPDSHLSRGFKELLI